MERVRWAHRPWGIKMEQDALPAWQKDQRSDGLAVIGRGFGGFVISLHGFDVFTGCPCCGNQFRTEAQAKRAADRLLPPLALPRDVKA